MLCMYQEGGGRGVPATDKSYNNTYTDIATVISLPWRIVCTGNYKSALSSLGNAHLHHTVC